MREVRLSHPDKVLFPDDGITKADLAAYYERVADAMLAHVRDRPLNLWRWNSGIDGERVVQQALPRGAPDWVKRIEVGRRRGGSVCHGLVNDKATLRWLANQNCITPHVWNSRADRLDRPDRIVFDLDPSDEIDFTAIREAALSLGELLRDLGLAPFAMTTGSRGIHVVAPLRRTRDAGDVREAAREIGAALADRHPDSLTTEWRKEKREGRILVDTARNTYAQTVVAPYAVRALPGAPVATPLAWGELEDSGLHAQRWTLRDVPRRLEQHGDPWAGIGRHARTLPKDVRPARQTYGVRPSLRKDLMGFLDKLKSLFGGGGAPEAEPSPPAESRTPPHGDPLVPPGPSEPAPAPPEPAAPPPPGPPVPPVPPSPTPPAPAEAPPETPGVPPSRAAAETPDAAPPETPAAAPAEPPESSPGVPPTEPPAEEGPEPPKPSDAA